MDVTSREYSDNHFYRRYLGFIFLVAGIAISLPFFFVSGYSLGIYLRHFLLLYFSGTSEDNISGTQLQHGDLFRGHCWKQGPCETTALDIISFDTKLFYVSLDVIQATIITVNKVVETVALAETLLDSGALIVFIQSGYLLGTIVASD